jgi:WD40 repeat protein
MHTAIRNHYKPINLVLVGFTIFVLLVISALLMQRFASSVGVSVHTTSIQTWTLSGPVTALAFSPDGSLAAVGLKDGSIQLRPVMDGKQRNNFIAYHNDEIATLVFSHNGQMLASTGEDNAIRLWQVRDGSLLQEWTNGRFAVQAIAFDPQDRVLASNGANGTVQIWDISDGNIVTTLPGSVRSSGSYMAFVMCLQFNRTGQVLMAGTDDYTIQQWQLPGGKMVHSQQSSVRQFNSGGVSNAAFSPDDHVVAMTSGCNPDIYLWQAEDGKLLHTLQGHRTDIWSLAFSPDGQRLASGSGQHCQFDDGGLLDTSIRVWSVSGGRQETELRGHTDSVASLAWSSEGNLLASGSYDGTVRLWQLK